MRISYNEATAMGCSTLWDDLILCEQTGFEFIELRLDMLSEFEKEHSYREIASFFQDSVIKPSFLNALYLFDGLSVKSEAKRTKEFLKLFDHACEIASHIGIPGFIIVPPFTDDGSPYPITQDTPKRVAEILNELAGKANGLILALEPVGAKKCSLPTITSCKEIIALSGLKNVGLAVDICNIFQFNEGEGVLQELAEIEADDVSIVHICDYDKTPFSTATREERCFCGTGLLPIAEYISTLKAIGYDGAVSIELFRPEYYKWPNSTVIRKAFETTKAFL